MTCRAEGGGILAGCDDWAATAAIEAQTSRLSEKGGSDVAASMAAAGGAMPVTGLCAFAPNEKAGTAAAALELAALAGAGAAANGLKTPLLDGDQALKPNCELPLGDAAASVTDVDCPETAGATTGVRAFAPNEKAGTAAAALELAALAD